MDFKIRPATIYDINEIYEIEKQCFDEIKRFEKNLFYYFLFGKNCEIFLVAEINGNNLKPLIVGFIVAYLNNNKNYEIITLNVLEKYRRNKIGSKLMYEVENKLKYGLKSIKKLNKFTIELMVYEHNFPAIQLYEKMGYIKQKIIENYYQDKRNGIKMIKIIDLKH